MSKAVRPQDRQRVLDARRRLKMACSAHAYVRGNTVQYYEWLQSARGGSLPAGPPVWICGDCHAGNLGPVANHKGSVEIEIRDLDQTVIGNPAHDLIRLGLSLATAARGSDLPGVTTAHMLEQMIDGYERALSPRAAAASASPIPKPVRIVLRKALNRTWRHLAEERIEDVRPTIPLGKKFWSASRDEKQEIRRVFATPEARELIASLKQRDDSAAIRVLDMAYWMKGCSSLGGLRYAVLLGIGNGDHRDGGLCLMDLKEAVRPAAPRSASAPMPRDNAKRVVEGARHLSPFLGGRMMATRVFNRSMVVRELLPQDLKLEMDNISREEAVGAARFLAEVVGRAHARQMDAATRAAWRADLARNRSKSLDAPSWLWSSVVELVATHEMAYLEHCRKYANNAA